MKPAIWIICTCLFLPLCSVCQTVNNIEINPHQVVTEIKHGIFITLDSSYNFSRVIDETGRIIFRLGFLNSDSLNSHNQITFHTGKNIKSLKKHFYRNTFNADATYPKYELIKGIDTLYSYRKSSYSYFGELDTLDRDYLISWNDLLDDIEYSYVLQKIGMNINEDENSLVVLYPDHSYNLKKEFDYIAYKLLFYGDSVYFKRIMCKTICLHGYKIVESDSFLVDEKGILKVSSLLQSCKSNVNYKPYPRDRFLMFYHGQEKQFYLVMDSFKNNNVDVQQYQQLEYQLHRIIGRNWRRNHWVKNLFVMHQPCW